MSPDQGRRGTSGKGGGRKAPGPAPVRRLGLAVFGILFVALFVVVAIAEGIGDPSIPSGSVILVQDVPGDAGDITKADIDHAMELSAVQAGEKAAPKPGDPKYDETKEAAAKFFLEGVWIQGQAAEWGIEVTEQEIEKELKKIKKESFKSEAEFQKFLKESHYTTADINYRVKIQILSTKLQEQLKEKAPDPTQSEVENYYEAAKSSQFTQQASRDIRLVVNKDSAKAEEARDELSKDNSAANWSKVAKELSEDPSSKANGGLKESVGEGALEEPLGKAAFEAPEGQIEGPLKTPQGYNVFEVVKANPETVQELKTVESQIKATLAQRLEQEYFAHFVATYTGLWASRTFCDSEFMTERCANYKGSGHPTTAPPACFEANPKGGLPEACPAPVAQAVPALPGTVTPLEPTGKPLAQRPRPQEEKGKGAATEGELPPGVAPPPAEEAPPSE